MVFAYNKAPIDCLALNPPLSLLQVSLGHSRRNETSAPALIQRHEDWTMKTLVISAALLGIVAMPVAAEAKGCIKGAIVGGIAGHVAGHGKLGAIAGCVIGHHEANRRDANKVNPKTQPAGSDSRI
jgi:hypothetical protein